MDNKNTFIQTGKTALGVASTAFRVFKIALKTVFYIFIAVPILLFVIVPMFKG